MAEMIETIEALTLFLYLLPGVVGFFVYETLAEKRTTESSFSIAAIVTLTFLSVLVSSSVFGQPILPTVDPTNKTVPIIFEAFFGVGFFIATVSAAVLGGVAAWLQNKNFLLRVLKFTDITRKTGKIDAWHQVFMIERGKWCRLIFDDETRLVGWPKYYSMHAKEAPQLFLTNATWHRKDQNQYVARDVNGSGVLITSWDHVTAIEILR